MEEESKHESKKPWLDGESVTPSESEGQSCAKRLIMYRNRDGTIFLPRCVLVLSIPTACPREDDIPFYVDEYREILYFLQIFNKWYVICRNAHGSTQPRIDRNPSLKIPPGACPLKSRSAVFVPRRITTQRNMDLTANCTVRAYVSIAGFFLLFSLHHSN